MGYVEYSQDNITYSPISVSNYWKNKWKENNANSIVNTSSIAAEISEEIEASILTQISGSYYTADEVNELISSGTGLDADYYTAAELDAGQLDNRYYTETEINTDIELIQKQLDQIDIDSISYLKELCTNFEEDANNNLVIKPDGNIILNPTGEYILPPNDYSINIGSAEQKFLSLNVAELNVNTLVSSEVVSTIGGRIVVGTSNTLIYPIDDIDQTIYVKYNNLYAGDTIYFESAGNVEFMQVIASVSSISEWTTESGTEWTTNSGSEWISCFETDGYGYTVTRAVDGTSANSWSNGQSLINTGVSGTGWIDLYAINSMQSTSQEGPTIVGNIRNSSVYNDWSPCWALGKLNGGLYGYNIDANGAAFGKYLCGICITIDDIKGIRFLDTSGISMATWSGTNITLGYTSTEHIALTSTAITFYDNTISYGSLSAGSYIIGRSDATHVTITSGTLYMYDASAAARIYMTSAGAIRLGYYASGYPNTLIDDTGFYVRNYATTLLSITDTPSITIGQVAASQNNIYMTSGAMYFRNNTTNVISITNTGVGSINLLAGSDITLTGDGTSPAQLIFNGSSYDTSMYNNLSGSVTYFLPSANDAVDLYIGIGGGSPKKYKQIFLQAMDYFEIYLDTSHFNFSPTYLYPYPDDSLDCGVIGSRWDDIYATNGTIQTSDERLKKEIMDCDLGLDFIKTINPISFLRGDTISGNKEKKIHTRRHYGLSAQQVAKALEEVGVNTDDFAGYIYDKDSDRYGLRYEEFIAPMIKAIQELTDKVKKLEEKLND